MSNDDAKTDTPAACIAWFKEYLGGMGYDTEPRDANKERWSRRGVDFEIGYSSQMIRVRWRSNATGHRWQVVDLPYSTEFESKACALVAKAETIANTR